jgi:hypothetical protein
MKRTLGALIVALLAGVFAWQVPGVAAGGDDVPRMAKEELKTLLGSPEVVILDVRLDGGNAPRRITGSVYEDPDNVSVWAPKYPKEKKIVLYCS